MSVRLYIAPKLETAHATSLDNLGEAPKKLANALIWSCWGSGSQ